MGSAPADDDPEGDHGIRARLKRRLRDDRQLEAARDPHDVDGRSGCLEHPQRAGEKALGDPLVPEPGDDRHAESRSVRVEDGAALTAHVAFLSSCSSSTL